MDSHMPYRDSGAVPASMKSWAFFNGAYRVWCRTGRAPMSRPFGVRGPPPLVRTKYGPNLPCMVSGQIELEHLIWGATRISKMGFT